MPAATCLGAHLPPTRPCVPARDRPCPRGSWSGSGAHLFASPAHPTGPAPAPWPRGSGPLWTRVRTEGPQLSSGQLRGGRARRDALAGRGLGKGGSGQRTRGICGSARPFLQPRALPDRLRTSAEFAKSVPRGPAQPPNFPESAVGGAFTIKKPPPGARAVPPPPGAGAQVLEGPGRGRPPVTGEGRGGPAPGPGHRPGITPPRGAVPSEPKATCP